MKEYLKASLEIESGKEFNFEIEVEYSESKEYNEVQTWLEITIDKISINEMWAEEAKEILESKITCIHIEEFLDNYSDVDYIFGGMDYFIEELKLISKEEN